MYNNAFFKCIIMKTRKKNHYKYKLYLFFFHVFIIMYLKMHLLDMCYFLILGYILSPE